MVRLVDHLHAAAIQFDLAAVDMQQAIRLLTEGLCAAHGLVDQLDSLRESALVREAEVSTCLGAEIAVPHGTLPVGYDPLLALGLSASGLPLPTPDGKPVHCVVLLAVPEDCREFHVQLLAEIARTLGMQEPLRRSVYGCSDPSEVLRLLSES